jgi:hypothetical protein
LARLFQVQAQAAEEHPSFGARKIVFAPLIELSVPDNFIDTFESAVPQDADGRPVLAAARARGIVRAP